MTNATKVTVKTWYNDPDHPDGLKTWHDENNKLHRDGDEPAMIYPPNGKCKIWYFHGLVHRENGPAKIWNDGSKEWWVNGKPHRLDGPAMMESRSGQPKAYMWFIEGKEMTFVDWLDEVRELRGEEHAIKMKLKWVSRDKYTVPL